MKGFIRLLAALLVVFLLPQPAHAAQPTVAGKSVVLMECATGTVLCQQNPHEKLAPASVTKIMTMLLIMEALDSGQISLTDTVTASEAAAAKGGSQVYLKVGETMTVSDMLKSIAVSSANDCACAMAEFLAGTEQAFVEKMNEKAAALGMKDTHFVNCTGLDDGADAKDHRTSAYDIALMSRELLTAHPDIKRFTTIWMDSVRGGSFGLSNTNKLIRFYPGATGLKTGFTSGAGYCLSASALRDGLELIAVVMGCQTSAQRFTTCRQMLDYGFSAYTLYEAPVPADAAVPVKLGKHAQVSLTPQGDCRFLVEKAKASALQTQMTLTPEVSAPVHQGDVLGQAQVVCDGEVLLTIPLTAAQDVPRKTFADFFFRLLGLAAMADPQV